MSSAFIPHARQLPPNLHIRAVQLSFISDVLFRRSPQKLIMRVGGEGLNPGPTPSWVAVEPLGLLGEGRRGGGLFVTGTLSERGV